MKKGNSMKQQGQRSKEWFAKKNERWGASTIKGLMGDKPFPKSKGGDGVLRYMWSDKAKTLIFTMFMRRLTHQIRDESYTTFEMQRGLDLEPLAFERFSELYLQYELMESAELVNTGFILFPDSNGAKEWNEWFKGENDSAGASPDHLLYKNGILVSGIETKARGEEAGYSHAFGIFDENHPDFWQVQAQMHACGVDYWYYLNYDDEVGGEWDISVKKVQLSPMHIDKMLDKIKTADKIISEKIEIYHAAEIKTPHDKNAVLTEIRESIRNLKEVW